MFYIKHEWIMSLGNKPKVPGRQWWFRHQEPCATWLENLIQIYGSIKMDVKIWFGKDQLHKRYFKSGQRWDAFHRSWKEQRFRSEYHWSPEKTKELLGLSLQWPHNQIRLSPIRRFALRYGPPYATYATAASEWRLRNQFCTWVVAPLNPRWRSIQFFSHGSARNPHVIPCLVGSNTIMFSRSKKCCFLLLLINPDCRLRSQNWWLWLGELAAVNGVRSSNLTGLDASVSRLIPTVNQTVCWYTIYIYPPRRTLFWWMYHPSSYHNPHFFLGSVILLLLKCVNIMIETGYPYIYDIYIYTW